MLGFFNRRDARSTGRSPRNLSPLLHTFDGKIMVSKDLEWHRSLTLKGFTRAQAGSGPMTQ